MIGVERSWGTPFSPWQAEQSCAFCSSVSARDAAGKIVSVVARRAINAARNRMPRRSRLRLGIGFGSCSRGRDKKTGPITGPVSGNLLGLVERSSPVPSRIDGEGDDVVAALVVGL